MPRGNRGSRSFTHNEGRIRARIILSTNETCVTTSPFNAQVVKYNSAREAYTMTTGFEVRGPFLLKVKKGPGGKYIPSESVRDFWDQTAKYKDRRGCYVFCIRASRGTRPVYIGKATKSYGREIFTPSKMEHYYRALAHSGKGTPIFYFVCYPPKKGKTNGSHIDQLETFLIQQGKYVSASLQNKKKVQVEKWSINGVLRSTQGKPSSAAKNLKSFLEI
jgi:hypothetical protein